jgi:pimeloyl-ACP methyl ester carboxylesterase/class 3 adenylate cyclase
MPAKTHYVSNNGVSIAYQVTGEGPIDLVMIPGFISHLELDWTNPGNADYLRSLMGFARLIRFDKRGTGLSDRIPAATLEERADDVRAVMDAAGVERAALFGLSEGGAMAALFAATYPERVTGLILYGSYACGSAAPEEGGVRAENYPRVREIVDDWGEGRIAEVFAPSVVSDENARRVIGTYERSAASPGMARALIDASDEIDVRPILPTIQVPTLVLHRRDEMVSPVEAARYMAAQIPGAKLVELPGNDQIPWVGDRQALVNEIEEFLTGMRHIHEPDRVLATVLFTDIVGSTEKAAELGDARWRELLERHDEIARRQVESFRGRVVKTLGDGMLACFDGPARAVRCAEAILDSAPSDLGVSIRAGVHTGECEAIDADLGGMAVHIGSRVAAKAAPGEVLVSGTVKDLVVGSGLAFDDAGEHELKGVPGQWRLYRVAGRTPAPAPIEPATAHMTQADRMIGRLARRAPGAMRALTRLTVKERSATH